MPTYITKTLCHRQNMYSVIYIYSSATSTSINQYANTHCIVYSNGEVLWVPPAQFTVLCSLNLKYWPFDTQECYMKFGSWTYSGDQIDMESYNNATAAEVSKNIVYVFIIILKSYCCKTGNKAFLCFDDNFDYFYLRNNC